MPDEFGGYGGGGEAEPEGPSFQERAEEGGAAFKTAVEKIGVGKIVAVIILLAVAFVVINLPRPITVDVAVSALDGGEVAADTPDIVVAYSDLFGSQRPKVRAVGDGFRVSVPSKTQVRFEASVAGFEHKSVTKTFEGDGNVELELARVTDLAFVSPSISGSMGPDCQVAFSAEVANSGSSSELFELVSDLKSAFTAVSGEVSVDAGGRNSSQFLISSAGQSEGGEVSGSVRIKGTEKKLPVSLKVGKTPTFDVPAEISFTDSEDKFVVDVRNNGESDVSGLKVAPSDALKDRISITGFNPRILKRDDKLTFIVQNNGLVAGDVELLTVSADCASLREIVVRRR